MLINSYLSAAKLRKQNNVISFEGLLQMYYPLSILPKVAFILN